MSTVKISELTALTSADAADELVIVDDSAGVTKKITHANLANFGTRTVTAGAIDFSGLANAAGMTSEVLDDYERGTWVPTFRGRTSGAITGTYAIQAGDYVKIGDLVFVSGVVLLATLTSTHNDACIANLPFGVSSDGTFQSFQVGFGRNFNGSMPTGGLIFDAGDLLNLRGFVADAHDDDLDEECTLTSSSYCAFSAVYTTS